MRLSLEDLDAAVEFEKRWDVKLGSETRAHRELLSFTAARILQAGASPGDVVGYLRELIEQFWTDPDPAAKGSS